MLETVVPIVGAALTAVVATLLVYYNARGPRPRLVRQWGQRPVVRVPYGSPISVGLVQSAIDWWTVRGAPMVHQVSIGGHDIPKPGEIVVTLIDQGVPDHAGGMTRWTTLDSTGLMISATVLVPNDVSFLVLIHELGHALGFEHVSGHHVMNARIERVTQNDRGIREAFEASELRLS